MKKKLDELTYVGGENIRNVVFKFNMLIIGIYTIFGIGEAYISGSDAIGNMHVLIGIMPFAMIGLIYPTTIYTLEYYQKVKFYMVSLKDVYFYNLKEFYNVRNIVAFLGVAFLYDVGMHFAVDTELFRYFLEIFGGFAISPLFVSVGFFVTTIFAKGYRVMRIGIYLLVFILTIPMIVMGIVVSSHYIMTAILVLVGVIGTFLISLPMNFMERKMEV